jgi:carbon-monoxide dehydrogenase medium subunit/xanthine dehydrogenase FAD-binding subunit
MIKEVYKAKNLDEVLTILDVKKSRAQVIAGGTDLIVEMRNDKFNKDILIDICDIEELKRIEDEGNAIKIGACATFNDIINSDIINSNLYGLKKASSLVGSPQIRSRATIGGNICNASPSADLIPPLLALEAIVCIQSKSYKRKAYLKDILLDKNHIDLSPNEVLTYIEFEKPKQNQVLSFSKLGFRKALSIAKISSSILLEIEENKFKSINIALGAVSKTGIREYEVEKYLTGKTVEDESINKALDILQDNITENLKGRSSGEFKSNAVRGVLKEAIYEGINLHTAINKHID